MRILSIEESRTVDQWAPTKAGLPLSLLMENAGHAVACTVANLYDTTGGVVLILAGTGNNGADGLVASPSFGREGCTGSLAYRRRFS